MSPLWQSVKVRSICMFTHTTLLLNINTDDKIIFNCRIIHPVGCWVDRVVSWVLLFFSAPNICSVTWNESSKFLIEISYRISYRTVLSQNLPNSSPYYFLWTIADLQDSMKQRQYTQEFRRNLRFAVILNYKKVICKKPNFFFNFPHS